MYTRGKEPSFDIRRIVYGERYDSNILENDLLESGYDVINRTIILIGEIPFGILFTKKWALLMPDLLLAVDQLQDYELLRDASLVRDKIRELYVFENISWEEYLRGELSPENTEAISNIFSLLRRQGIYLPYLKGCKALDRDLCKSLDVLLQDAPDHTFKAIFTIKAIDLDPKVRVATRGAVKSDLLSLISNGKCCKQGVGCVTGLPNQTCYNCNYDTPDTCGRPDDEEGETDKISPSDAA